MRGSISHVGHVLAQRGWSGTVPAEGPGALEFILMATGRKPTAGAGGPLNIYA